MTFWQWLVIGGGGCWLACWIYGELWARRMLRDIEEDENDD